MAVLERKMAQSVQALKEVLGQDWAVARGYQSEPSTPKQCSFSLESIAVSDEAQEIGGDVLLFSASAIIQAPRNVLDETAIYGYFRPVVETLEALGWTFDNSEFTTAREDNSELLSVLEITFTLPGPYEEIE